MSIRKYETHELLKDKSVFEYLGTVRQQHSTLADPLKMSEKVAVFHELFGGKQGNILKLVKDDDSGEEKQIILRSAHLYLAIKNVGNHNAQKSPYLITSEWSSRGDRSINGYVLIVIKEEDLHADKEGNLSSLDVIFYPEKFDEQFNKQFVQRFMLDLGEKDIEHYLKQIVGEHKNPQYEKYKLFFDITPEWKLQCAKIKLAFAKGLETELGSLLDEDNIRCIYKNIDGYSGPLKRDIPPHLYVEPKPLVLRLNPLAGGAEPETVKKVVEDDYVKRGDEQKGRTSLMSEYGSGKKRHKSKRKKSKRKKSKRRKSKRRKSKRRK